MRDSDTIEFLAIHGLEDILKKDYCLKGDLKKNDKTLTWDGFIEIYTEPHKSKKTFLNKIPIQMKGKEVKQLDSSTLKYSISIDDLKNFFKSRGTAYFVTEIDSRDNTRVFYNMLTRVDINILLENTDSNQQTKTIVLKELKDDSYSLRALLIMLSKDMEYQGSEIFLPMDGVKKIEEFSFNFPPFAEDSIEFIPAILNGEFCVYGKPNGCPIHLPFDKRAKISEVVKDVDAITSVNDVVYYDHCTYHYVKDMYSIRIGKSFTVFPEKETFEYQMRGTIAEQILAYQCLIAILSGSAAMLGGVPFKVKSNKVHSNKFWKKIEWLNDLLSVFNTLGISTDIELDLLNESELKVLDTLVKIMIRKEFKFASPFESGIKTITLAGKKYCTFFMQYSEDDYRVHNLFGQEFRNLRATFNDSVTNGQTIISSYIAINAADILELCNFNGDIVADSFLDIPPSQIAADHMIHIPLQFILAYDISKNTMLLEYAKKMFSIISLWEIDQVTIDICRINILQIEKRIRSLSIEEKNEVRSMKLKYEDSPMVCCGISLLLENWSEYEFYYSKLMDGEKLEFDNYPIHNLCRNL